MGTCECENNAINNKELKYFFVRNDREAIKAQPDANRRENQKRKRIIKKFIIKNISRLCKKEKYNNIKSRAQNIFFDKEELNFKYNKSYFKQIINKKLDKYFNEKEIILKDLFSYNLIDSLHSFPKIRDKISSHHNNDIVKNHKKYLSDLISFLDKKKSIDENENNIKKILENEVGDNINEIEEDKKNNEVIKNEKNNLLWDVGIFIKKEIDNFFDVCFGSTKKNFVECQKKSIFLNILILQDNKNYPQINFTWELRKLIKLLYYIYLLKKYNFLSDTNNCFYKISPMQIKKKSIMIDKIIINKRESIIKNENKMKLLKKVMTKK